MIRKNARILCVGVLALLGVSCVKNETVGQNHDNSFVLSSFVADYPVPSLGEDTKSEAASLIYRVYWNVGDRIAVINVSQGNRVDTYTSVARVEDTGGAGRFDADGVYSYNADDIVFAVYPYNAFTDISTSGDKYKLTVELLDNLTYTNKSDSPMFERNNIQVSNLYRASDLQLSGDKRPGIVLNRMTSMVRILSHISTETLNKERVSAISVLAKGLAGSADVVFSGKAAGATPSIQLNSGSEDRMNVTLGNNLLMASTTPIAEFIPVFPIWLGSDATRDGLDILFTTEQYYVDFHREMNTNLTSNGVLAMNIFEGAYTHVFSEKEAVGDYKWWYTFKKGGMNSSGSFEGYGTEMGSTAGGFSE